MKHPTTRNSDSQFDREHPSLMSLSAQMVRNVFLSLSVTTSEKPNDILRAVRIALRKFAQGHDTV